ncbi:MAG: histidine ammonia-lyase [Oligoflexales bacterium]|nr:histidine ammonia-lyase [Oligoflexales bacterium]
MKTSGFALGSDQLTTKKLVVLSQEPNPELSFGADVVERLRAQRSMLTKLLAEDKALYGINTGFGFLSSVRIPDADLQQLQVNLIRSHACGMGEPLSQEAVRGLLVVKAHNLALGGSGVRPDCIEKIIEFLKHDILPMIPIQGSVGASGDLAPLAHLAMGLLGEGEVYYKGQRESAASALRKAGVKPFRPEFKEGLSLINGTQFMTVISAHAFEEARTIFESSLTISALSIDAFQGSIRPFDPRIHALRPHRGQSYVAKRILSHFSAPDEILENHAQCNKVQDPYSFRCIPQVYGATYDALCFVDSILQVELNSVTDNPLVFEGGQVVSGGNFHGQSVSMAMDFLAIAVSEIASLSERRIDRMISPQSSGLSTFLVKKEGLNSGFMIPQVTAAALVSENKVLSHPASVDSIPTNVGKEDHVSMGPFAARKAAQVVQNVAKVLAIELLTACQALDFLKPLKPGPALLKIYERVREQVSFMEEDRSLSAELMMMEKQIRAGVFIHE